MARLRKAGRLWRAAAARDAAACVMVDCKEPYFTLDPISLFGRAAPLEVELGAGRGDFIIARASTIPQRNFLAIELAAAVARFAAVHAGRKRLDNLRILRMDARPLVNLFLPDSSVAAYHIYFPDPWPKTRHSKHRLFTKCFAANLMRTLSSEGSLYVVTDVREYAEAIFSMVEAQGLGRTSFEVPGLGQTAFARRFVAEGRPVYSASFIK
jgi:tRNA (guanine-N7-)-methyltransferase